MTTTFPVPTSAHLTPKTNSIFEAKAIIVVSGVASDSNVMNAGMASDVRSGPFIDLITSLLPTVLPQLIACLVKPPASGTQPTQPTPEEVHQALITIEAHPIREMLLHRQINKELQGPGVSRRASRVLGQPLFDHTIKMCKGCTVADTKQALEEIGNY